MMCEQTGQEIEWDKCPPDWEDFPELISTILNIYNSLGDRVFPDIGFLGKDFTTFNFLLEHYDIQKHEIDFVFKTILWLDSRAIKESQKRLKREMDRLKRK